MANKKVSQVEDDFIDQMLVEWLKAGDAKIQQARDFLDSMSKARAPELKTPKVVCTVNGIHIYEHDFAAPEGVRAVFLKRLRAAQPPALPEKP